MPKDTLFTEEENRVLKKYKKPRAIDPEDKKILDRYSAIGFVGYHDLDLGQGIDVGTAGLTPEGLKHLNR